MAQTRKTAKKTARTSKKRTSAGKKTGGKKAASKKTSGKKAGGKKAAKKPAPADSSGEHPTVTMVRGLAEVVEAHSLSELIVDTPDLTLTLRRAVAGQISATGAVLPAAAPAPLAAPVLTAQAAPVAVMEAAPAPAAQPAEAAPDDNYHVVTSPFVGTFYKRPNPDAAPYVEPGGRVDKGQALCIIEAMKLMNEIEADMSGTVVAILVEDGEPVEYGQALFKIDPA